MIDLILRASTKADMGRWARDHGLMERYIETPAVLDTETGEETTPAVMAWRNKPGLEWSWWNETGKLMTARGTYDAEGNELTAPSFAPGVVLLLRIHGEFFKDDNLTPAEDDPEKDEQWARSKVVRYIKNNGTPGIVLGIRYYELDGIQVYKPEDVAEFIAARNVPDHRFL